MWGGGVWVSGEGVAGRRVVRGGGIEGGGGGGARGETVRVGGRVVK